MPDFKRNGAMTLIHDLQTRLEPQLTKVPAVISAAEIRVRYSDDAVARGIVGRVAQDLSDSVLAALPLFAAGFCAIDRTAGQGIGMTVGQHPSEIVVTVENAAHNPMLLQLLLYLIAVQNQSPPGAYERLLAVLDGDEDAAAAIYAPLDFAGNVTRITARLHGNEPHAFDLSQPLPRAGSAAIAARISSDGGRQVFSAGTSPYYSDDMDNGFLTLQNAGVFAKQLGEPSPTEEPEIFVDRAAHVVVDGWHDAPDWLAELLWTISGGQAVRIMDTEAE